MTGYLVRLQRDGDQMQYLLGPYRTFDIAERMGQECINKRVLVPADEWVIHITDVEVEE